MSPSSEKKVPARKRNALTRSKKKPIQPVKKKAKRKPVSAAPAKKALRKTSPVSTDYLTAIFANTDTGYFVFDSQMRLKSINRKCRIQFKQSTGKIPVIGQSIIDVIPKVRKQFVLETVQKVFRKKEISYEAARPDERNPRYYFRVTIKPLLDKNKKVFAALGTITDITAEKAATADAAYSRELTELFVEHMPAAVAMLDTKMRYVAHSKRWITDYKLPKKSIIGKSHYKVFPGIPENWKAIHKRCLAGATESSESDSFVREDGSITYTRWQIRPWHKSNGEIGGLIMFTEVLNRQKETEKKLDDAYRQLNFHINNTPLMMIEEDHSGKIIRWSKKAEEVLGWKEHEVIGKKTKAFLFAEDREEKACNNESEAEKEREKTLPEIKLYTKKQAIKVCRSYCSTMLRPDGSVEGRLLIFADLTNEKLLEKKAWQAEAQFRGLVEKSHLCVYIIGDGKFLYVNPAFAAMFGYTPQEMMTSVSIVKPIYPADWEKVESTMAAGLRGEIDHARYEIRAIRKNGEVFWADVDGSITPFNDQLAVIGSMTDITERKEREFQLQKTLNELSDYKVALDESCIVSIMDPDGVITYVNDNFCQISKFPREELLGKKHSIINSGYHPKAFFETQHKTIQSGKIWRGEIQNKGKDGSVFWVDSTIVPFLNTEGNLRQYICIRHDITKRKNAETAQMKSETNLHIVLDNTDTAYVLMNEEMEIVSINAAAEDWGRVQLGKTDFLGHTLPSLFPPERGGNLQKALEQVREKGVDIQYEIGYPQKDGSTSWFLVKLYPIYHQKDKVTGMLGSILDITKNKNEETERNRMTSEMIMRNRDLEQFGYIVSHNLRSPVANITGLVKLMKQMSNDDPSYPRLSEMLVNAANTMDSIIRDLNEILLMKRGLTENREAVDPAELIDVIIQSIRPQLNAEGAVVNTDFSAVGKIYTIKSYINSIFYNLITNSIKYRHPERQPVIIISGRYENNKLVFRFSDNGMGIDLKMYGGQVFGLYKRFHSHTEGKGMGLYMVKTQVEGLGGTISLESEPDKGTTFTIVFPSEFAQK